MPSYAQRCRICGCTQARGCASGCSWVEVDLCSVCQVIRDVVLVLCASVPRQMGRLLKLTSDALEDLDDLDEKTVRKAVADLRATRELELARDVLPVYRLTPKGRRVHPKVVVRVRRDVPSLVLEGGV